MPWKKPLSVLMRRALFLGPALAASCMAQAQAVPQFAAELVEPGIVSSEGNDYNYSESKDGSWRIFARSPKSFSASRIYVSRQEQGKWSEPRQISFSDSRYRDSDPYLTDDGTTLYFVSDRPTATRPQKKDLDIWRSRLDDNGQWSAPEHLGELVNGAADELGPELHGGTLYFNATPEGGRSTVYQARQAASGFDRPRALAAPIVSGEGEGDFTVSRDGKVAMFWSRRGGQYALYAAARDGGSWSAPVKLGPHINAPSFNFTPWFSHDGKWLYFASMWKNPAPSAQPALFNGEANVYRIPAAEVYGAAGVR